MVLSEQPLGALDSTGLRAVAYIRVSVEREGMISPELQMQSITDYSSRHGYRIVRVLEDLDLSGRFWKTRQVDAAIAMIESGKADVLLVWRWSRVSRNRLDWAIALDRVEVAGGRLESATEGFDTTTSVGRFARGMLAEFAAFESDRMGDIWRAAAERRVRLGLPPNGQRQLGYRKINGLYQINRRTGPIVGDLYRRYAAGESFASLCRLLRSSRVGSVNPTMGGTRRRSLYAWDPHYLGVTMDRGFPAGYIRHLGELLPGTHKPLITPAEWAAYLQARTERKRRQPTTTAPPQAPFLKGLLFCDCGNPMTLNQRLQEPGARFTCYAGHGRRRQRSIRTNRLTGLVFQWLARLATEPATGAQARETLASFVDQHRQAARQIGLDLRLTSDVIVRQRLTAELAEHRVRLRQFDPVEVAAGLVQEWHSLDNLYKRTELETLVSRIEVTTGRDHATLTFKTTWSWCTNIVARTERVEPCLLAGDQGAWLKPGRAAAHAGIGINTLRNWQLTGLLPNTHHDERDLIYLQSDLDRVRSHPPGPRRAALKRELSAVPTNIG